MSSNLPSENYQALISFKEDLQTLLHQTNPKRETHTLWKITSNQVYPGLHQCFKEITKMIAFKGDNEFYKLSLITLIKRLKALTVQNSSNPFLQSIISQIEGLYQTVFNLLPQEIETVQLELFTPEQVPPKEIVQKSYYRKPKKVVEPIGVQLMLDFQGSLIERIREELSSLTLRAARKVAKALQIPQKIQGKDRKLREFRQVFYQFATQHPREVYQVLC